MVAYREYGLLGLSSQDFDLALKQIRTRSLAIRAYFKQDYIFYSLQLHKTL